MREVYIASVVEVIKHEGKPTLDLRVRVPSIHGNTIRAKDLPIAKPVMMPGVAINWNEFIEHLQYINKVYVIFDGSNYTRPMYLGAVSEYSIYQPHVYDSISEGIGDLEDVVIEDNEALKFTHIKEDGTITITVDVEDDYFIDLVRDLVGELEEIHIGEEGPEEDSVKLWFKEYGDIEVE